MAQRWCSIRRTRRLFPFIERIFADAGYQGPRPPRPSQRPAPGNSRSSSATSCTTSSSCPNAGSSSEPSPGSAATAASRATSSATPNRRRLRPSRHDPHHAPTLDQANSLFLNPNFLDRLLDRHPPDDWLPNPSLQPADGIFKSGPSPGMPGWSNRRRDRAPRLGSAEIAFIKAHLAQGSCWNQWQPDAHHAGAGSGGGRSSAINRKISVNSILGTATSAIWNAT